MTLTTTQKLAIFCGCRIEGHLAEGKEEIRAAREAVKYGLTIIGTITLGLVFYADTLGTEKDLTKQK